MRRILVCLVLFASITTSIAEKEELVSEFYNFRAYQRVLFEKFSESNKSIEHDLKELFGNLGVTWPEGSLLDYSPTFGVLVVKNTESSQEKIKQLFSSLDGPEVQVEVEIQFLEFDADAVEALLIDKRVTVDNLTKLWRNKQGKLRAAPKLITQSGVEATVKGVVEYIYPTDFGATEKLTDDKTSSLGMVVEPSGFETREVGSIFSILPEYSAEANMINLMLSPERVDRPEWREYKSVILDAKRDRKEVAIEQPFFDTFTLSTTVRLYPGRKIIVGGGTPSKDGKKINYAFVTAWLLDVNGNEVKPVSRKMK